MLLSEIIYSIKNLMAGGISSDDEDLSNSQLAFIVAYYRSKLLKQDLGKRRFNQELYVQNLGKVPITQVDKNECCDIENCILRTKSKIPLPIENGSGLNITFVGTLNGKPYQKYLHNTMPWVKAAKWTANEPKWFFQNGYLYFSDLSSRMIQNVNIQGVFERPEEAVKFRTCDCPNDENCFDSLDFEYPLPLHHVDTIIKLVAETELRLLTSIPTDTSNNALNQMAEMLKEGGPSA